MNDQTLASLLAASQSDCLRVLQHIQIGVWVLVVLATVALVVWYSDLKKRRVLEAARPSNWLDQIENAYDKGQYEKALESLAFIELTHPKSALIKFWRGRCYFRQENWQNAVNTFEECLRLEPYYRKSVRDYMAFIELNGLVQGVEGYLKNLDED